MAPAGITQQTDHTPVVGRWAVGTATHASHSFLLIRTDREIISDGDGLFDQKKVASLASPPLRTRTVHARTDISPRSNILPSLESPAHIAMPPGTV